MELGELVAVAFLKEELAECPFKDDVEGPSEEESENLEKDDRDSVQEEQANNGGTLGANLAEASAGKEGTVGGPCPAPEKTGDPARDTRRGGGIQVRVDAADGVDSRVFPFTVAAHHLIPGVAALERSSLKKYMKKGESVKTAKGKSYTLKNYIGYNVNGCHNGVWLAGNYAIRKHRVATDKKPERPNTSPVGGAKGGKSWGALNKTHPDWQLNYVAAATRAAGGQFHDAHKTYNGRAKKLLNKIAKVLLAHQDNCEDCESLTEIPPPYLVKMRLYALSEYFKARVTGGPLNWKRPWFASDRWTKVIFEGGRIKTEFADAYADAKQVGPGED